MNAMRLWLVLALAALSRAEDVPDVFISVFNASGCEKAEKATHTNITLTFANYTETKASCQPYEDLVFSVTYGDPAFAGGNDAASPFVSVHVFDAPHDCAKITGGKATSPYMIPTSSNAQDGVCLTAPGSSHGYQVSFGAAASSGNGGSKSTVVGFIAIAVAGFGFGSNFVVIKKYDPKDGLFFQFNMVIGVFFTGMVYHFALRGAPPLQPLAMLGGAGWALGNACCPFIIETIGMGLGLSIWGTVNMLTGWSSAHFGILGVAQESVPHQGLNIAGAAVAVLAICMYAQVQNKPAKEEQGTDEERAPFRTNDSFSDAIGLNGTGSINSGINGGRGAGSGNADGAKGQGGDESLAKALEARFGAAAPKGFGILASVGAGVLFGSCFNPAQMAIDQTAHKHCNAILDAAACLDSEWGATAAGMGSNRLYCSWDSAAAAGAQCGGMPGPDLAFSQFCGIFLASLSILVFYGVYKQSSGGQMYVNVPLIIPGIVSGVIWAFAQIGWFIASDNLSMVVSFPIITTLPAILANGYGYFIFDELDTGNKNVAKLLLGIMFSIVASVLTALAKLG